MKAEKINSKKRKQNGTNKGKKKKKDKKKKKNKEGYGIGGFTFSGMSTNAKLFWGLILLSIIVAIVLYFFLSVKKQEGVGKKRY